MKFNFSSVYHNNRKIVGKLSNRRVQMRNFTRIGPKTKKLWLSIILAGFLSSPAWDHPKKGVNYLFSAPESDQPYVIRTLIYAVSAGLAKR